MHLSLLPTTYKSALSLNFTFCSHGVPILHNHKAPNSPNISVLEQDDNLEMVPDLFQEFDQNYDEEVDPTTSAGFRTYYNLESGGLNTNKPNVNNNKHW